ncbi:MAG: hypothetical protein K5870_03520 [Lachnospiraceae bacterium]|nr:hypothetical protein [Lachnospiraceae bacterium]
MKITVLGARGSVATDGNEMTVFGGATSCVLVEAGNEAVFLDAGTGIVHAPDIGDRHISILITHPHIDHIVGLPFFPCITQQDRQIDIYAVPRLGLDTALLIKKLISPPFCKIYQINPIDIRSGVMCR